MARIKLFDSREGLTEAQAKVFDEIVSGPRGKIQGPLMAALHKPDLADKWQKFGAALRYDTTLPPRLSELVILVTAKSWACQLEWFLHEDYARKAGLEQEIIDAVKAEARDKIADGIARDVYDFCHELQSRKRVSETVYQRCLAHFGELGVMEMAALSGYYTMVAMTLNAHEFPLPAGATRPFAELP